MTSGDEDWIVPELGSILVVKLGGSLLLWEGMPDRLRRFLEWAGDQGAKVIVITGGSDPANFIRELDKCHQMPNRSSHDMAVRAMDLTSHCLAALMGPDLEVVDHFSAMKSVWETGCTPVLAPFRFLTEVDALQANALPANWRVTSDSIAARVAEVVKATDLVLLKSRDVPPGTSIREAVRLGLVDPMMPEMATKIPRLITVNFRKQSSMAQELINL